MTFELKGKLNNNARHLRFICRAQMFQRNRKQELDYLQFYPSITRQLIQQSLVAPIPNILPLLSPQTISYYRRSNTAIYRTYHQIGQQHDPHMTYESLWILAGLQEKQFENYTTVIKEFEQNLQLYLSSRSGDIRQIATIAAGNKIMGKEQDIIKLVQIDPRQLWVLSNHIYQKKISYKKLFPFLKGNHQIAFKTLYQLSNGREDGITDDIVADESALYNILDGLHSCSITIKKYAIRILGNIAAEKDEHVVILHNLNVLSKLIQLLQTPIPEMLRDVCWLISNLVCDKISSTKLICQQSAIDRLVQLFYCDTSVDIKRELTQIFISLAHYADRKQAHHLLAHHKLLELCHNQLCLDQNDLNNATLFLISKLIELGDNCRNESNQNVFCLMISSMVDLRREIKEKSFSQNNDISSISLQILGYLDEEESAQ